MRTSRAALLRLLCCAAIITLAADTPAMARQVCDRWTTSPFVDQPQGINGLVEAMTIWTAPGGASLMVVGGWFGMAGGAPANHIAAWDGASWRALGAGLDGPVYSLTVFNNELIAGGTFTSSNGVGLNRIARWNGQQWQSLGSGLQDSNPSTVPELKCQSLTVYNGELIAGGSFAVAGGVTASNIARWNGTAWNALSSLGGQGVQSSGSPGAAQVRGLTVLNNMLYVAGYFNLASNVLVSNIARWNGSAWSPLGAGLNSYVHELSQFNGEVVAGGDFTSAGGLPANSVARWNPNTSTWGTFGAGINQAPYTFQNFNGGLLAGGAPFGGTALMFWNGANWSTWNSAVSGSTPPWGTSVSAIAVYNGQVVVGGSFNHAGGATGPAVSNVSRFDGSLWQPVESYPGEIASFTMFGSRVVGGGLFTQSCGTGNPANNIALWNGTSLSRFGSGTNNPVMALKGFTVSGPFGGDFLVAGGFFTAINGIAANHVAFWNPDDILNPWSAMGSGFDDGYVYAIERHADVTYAAGSFTTSGGSSVNRIARWTGTTWQPLGTGMNGTVRAMQSYNGLLYVGGNFTSAGGVSTGGLARWNAATSTWSNVGGFFLGTVYCLTVHNGELVIGGLFPGINNSPNIAKYNGSSYSTPGTGGTNGQVQAVTSGNGSLFLGGDFTTAGGLSANRLARWSASSGWSVVPGGTNGPVSALAYLNGELHVGGPFNSAGPGGMPSPGWARYRYTGAPCCTGDVNQNGLVDVDDLVAVVISWGMCSGCPADVAPPGGNGIVDIDDLVSVIVTWGTCH